MVEFPRAAFTAVHTKDGVREGVEIGTGTSGDGVFVEFDDMDIVFVEFDDMDIVFVEFIAECEIWALFRLSCSLVHSPGIHR
jgi:hypothetical protein